MNAEKVSIMVHAGITYGHLGYLNLDDHQLICLYDECLVISQYLGDTLSVVQLLGLLGELKEKTHCFEESSKYFNMMLKVSEQKDNGKIVASAFMLIVTRHLLLSSHHKAVDWCEKAINISKNLGIKDMEGIAYSRLAAVYGELGKYHEMKECSENCLKIAKETRNKKLESTRYLSLGAAYLALGKWNEAISSSDDSIKIAIEINYKTILPEAYSLIGKAHGNLHNVEQALRFLELSLKTREEIGERSKHEEISSFIDLGDVCRMSGKYQEAIDYYQKALTISQDVRNKYKEGNLYIDLGGLYMAQGKYHKSIQYLEKSLKFFKDIGNRDREGEIYLYFASMYNNVGKYQESFENLKNSLGIAIETGNEKRQLTCYRHFGNIYHNLQKYEKAMEYLVKCLNCTLEIGDKMEEGHTNQNIGAVYLALNNPEEAIKHLEKSLDIAKSISDKEGEGYSFHYIAHAFFLMKKYGEAIRYEEKSLSIAKDIGNRNMEGYAYQALGSVYYKLSIVFDEEGDEEKCQNAKQKSEENLKDALECWELQFSHLKDLNDFKISIVDTFIKTYRLLTKVLIDRQKPEEALQVCDSGRARSLGDILVSRYGITVQRAPSQPPLHSTDLERVLSSNKFCILFFAIVDEDLYAWVLTHQKPIILVTINEQASATNKALRKFYFTKETQTTRCENRSFECVENFKRPNDGSEVQTKGSFIQPVERNVDPVEGPKTNISEQTTDQLEVLFSLLITPVVQHLQQEEIVIIPDWFLYKVPFAALKDPTTGKYLSETKSIRFSPSLTTLRALQECTVDHHSKTGALIVGDPDVGEVALRKEKSFLTRLPSAKHEADVIATILNAKSLTGLQATKEMVKKKLREGVAVIHIAAHGDSEHGHIALAPPPRTHATSIPEEQDYMLTMQEVQEIGVTAQLVVLSCCHSGRGELKAEGVVGMSRAFLAAGARAVVASLWAIDDEATLNFMISFYTFLKMGKSASKSLQKAMDDIRGEEDYKDPKYWAPFFLIGDDVTISL